jgi:hypothetical protein
MLENQAKGFNVAEAETVTWRLETRDVSILSTNVSTAPAYRYVQSHQCFR